MVKLRDAACAAGLLALACCSNGDQFRATMARVKGVTVQGVEAGVAACGELAISRIEAAKTEDAAAAAHAAGKRDCVERIRVAYNAAASAFNSALEAQTALEDGKMTEGEAVAAAKQAYQAATALRALLREMGLHAGKPLFDREQRLEPLGDL